MTTRYHIRFPNYHTTISMDKIISDLMAIKLGLEPETKKARQAVQQKLQQLIKPFYDPRRPYMYKLSRFVVQHAILDLLDNELSEQYWNWYLSKPMCKLKKV